MQREMVQVKSQTIKWIIDTSGYTIEELAKKLEVRNKDIENWISGDSHIAIATLEELSEYVQRPLLLFFSDNPPKEPELVDFRKLLNIQTNKLTPPTIISVRHARYLQSIANELMELQNMDLEPKINTEFTIDTSPDKAAQIERNNLDLENNAINDIEDFYKFLRKKIESLNIFVFQASFEIRELQGVSLTDTFPNAILINSRNTTGVKIFTLMHEYGHILLGNGGMCMPEYENNSSVLNTESWCNSFAAEILMPKDEFLMQYSNLEENKTLEQIIPILSDEFKISKLAIIIRIKNLVKHESFDHQLLESCMESEMKPEPIKTIKPDNISDEINLCISEKSMPFVSLVVNSEENDHITNCDILRHLDLYIQHLDEIHHRVN